MALTEIATPRREALSPLTGVAIALLVVLFVATRWYAIANAAAPARDAFRYAAAAERLSELGLVRGLQSIDCHPLFPSILAGMRRILLSVDAPDAETWFFAARIIDSVIYLAFLFVAWHMGSALVGPVRAAAGCLLVALVPRQIEYSVDVLTDPLASLLLITSLALFVSAWRRDHPSLAALGGLAGALAYLTRPEGLLAPIVVTLAAATLDMIGATRRSARHSLALLCGFVVAWGAVATPYMVLIGGVSPKNSARAIIGQQTAQEPGIKGAAAIESAHASTGILDETAPLGAAARVLFELAQETRGWLFVFAVVSVAGLCASRRRLEVSPDGVISATVSAWLAVTLCVLLAALRMKAGYLSGRYLMPALPFVGMAAVLGMEIFVRMVARAPRFPWERTWASSILKRRRVAFAWGGVAALGLLLCAPAWLVPSHQSRAGFADASQWLKDNSRPGDRMLDPVGRVSLLADRSAAPMGESDHAFAIIDVAEWNRLADHDRAALEAARRDGQVVARFARGGSSGGEVIEIIALHERSGGSSR